MSTLSTADKELLKQVEQDKIEYIRFERCDLYCRSIGKLIPVTDLKNYLLNGIGIPKPVFSIVGNYNNFYVNDTFHNTANVTCFPYHSTYNKLPPILCRKANIGRIMYYFTYSNDNINIKTRKIFNVDPRAICLTQLRKLKDELQIDLYSAFEHEFQIFHKPKSQNGELIPVWEHKEFMNNVLLSEHEDFMIDCERSLRSMNVNLETMHLEFAPGCYEWAMKPSWNIKAADDSFTYKTIIKQIAIKYNYIASFATTPECDKTSGNSNGAHYNHSLWNKNGKNLFYDKNSNDKISLLAKYWIGGIFKHIKGITCFSVPTINCYRRVRSHSWAPADASWGFSNRYCLIRVKREGEKNTYFEYRLSCCACNPYLVIASIIMAGMDGIKNKILPPISSGPIKDDPNVPHNQGKFEKVPQYLGDALDQLLNDNLICDGFGDMFIESYVSVKRMEIDSFNQLTEELKGNQDEAERQMFSKL